MTHKYHDAAFFNGKTISEIKQLGDDEIRFTADGLKYRMFHSQDCCESVSIYNLTGTLEFLIGSPLTSAYEEISYTRPDDEPKIDYAEDSETWTTYFFATTSAMVRIRWWGISNGYYGENVGIEEVE